MNFDLVQPCDNCPFRNDIRPYISAGRIEEIRDALDRTTFSCHKTVLYDDQETRDGDKTQHCAGALILMEKENHQGQMMRIAERLGLYDHRKLKMDSPVYDSFEDMICAAEMENA